MKLDRTIRLVIVAFTFLLFFVVIGAILFVTESALNIWDRLLRAPRWLVYGYLGLILSVMPFAAWLVFRLVFRRTKKPPACGTAQLSQADIKTRMSEAQAAGVPIDEARAELRELAARRESGSVHLCFFGEVSAGKSSLIKALVPDAEVVIGAVGGSTTDIRYYHWQDRAGAKILLTDVPGTGARRLQADGISGEEARRAQLVLFVCDSDLTRAELDSLGWLLKLNKPLILVLNKSDRYSDEEQAALMRRLLDRLSDLGSELSRHAIVAVSAGGTADVVRRSSGGSETTVRRPRPADIGVLVVAINRLLGADPRSLDSRRDRAVFYLAAEKLTQAERQYRQQRAEQIVRSATRNAVLGALADVSPGSDLVIQGYVGTNLVRTLCQLFGVSPRDLDIESFLTLSQSRAGRMLPLSMAVAGNGLKAFPGLGTLAGGLVHAVAYGLIFDALGQSLVRTLQEEGKLVPETTANEFEERFGEYIEAGVRQVAQMAMERQPGGDRD